jgi:hypothetical protein
MGGYKYETFIWVVDLHGEYGGWVYVPSYQGDSLFRALLDIWKHRRSGVGCIKLEIRDV